MPTEVEVSSIPNHWHGAPFDPALARPGLLHELFEAQADANPTAIAMVCAGERRTYSEVEKKANQLARFLRARGAGRGALVAIWLPRSEDVYLALLAILKSGAAYVPLDADYPAARISHILADASVQTLVTTAALAANLEPSEYNLVLLDKQWDEVAQQPEQRLARAETGATPEDLCYVIYTSGSTGRPKGVEIEHRSACNLVRAEGRIFEVRPEDRVYQGFSIAFDASVEEIWLAWFAGATLVSGTKEMVQAGPGLPRLLSKAGITVLSCVPTLLTMMDEDIPTVRLLIVGGEVCPASLVRRWCKPGRRMVNTYGPTENTVIATYGDCDPNKAVTIGRPVPNYRCHILDGQMQPVPAGVTGELYIGGAGLARGYLGKPGLTAERFIGDPLGEFRGHDPDSQTAGNRVISPEFTGRLYRTGDLARFTQEGEIEFMGRADTQVKLRGYRIELSEIESVLLECPEIRSAVVTLREDTPGLQELAGYMVPRDGAAMDEGRIKTWLRTRLPSYMVPALLETVASLPLLPSGKVDRKSLPPPRTRSEEGIPTCRDSHSSFLSPRLFSAWQAMFQPAAVCENDNFFLDLGGHSLLATALVSELRSDPDFQDLSVSDIYSFPTARALAAELESRRERKAATAAPLPRAKSQEPRARGRLAHLLCGSAQFVALYFIAGFFALQWLTPYVAYSVLVERGRTAFFSIAASLGILLGLYPLMLLFSIAAKWAVIGRFKAGSYPLWGFYYFRWWLLNKVIEAAPVDYLSGTPLLNIYYRLMGARIGARVYFRTDAVGTFDLLAVGDDSSIGTDASLLGHKVEDGMLKLGPITIGQRCSVGACAVLDNHTRMEDGSSLGELSLLSAGACVPQEQMWTGSPARPLPQDHSPQSTQRAQRTEEDPAIAKPKSSHHSVSSVPSVVNGRARFVLCTALHAVGVFILPAVYLSAIFPGVVLLNDLSHVYEGQWYLCLAPLVALSFVVLMCLEIVLAKWFLLGRVKPGSYGIFSSLYLRKWFVDQLMDLSLDLLGPLYATLYLNPWYRLLGAKLGKRAELSTACDTSPDLLSIGDEAFVADAVCLGPPRVQNGRIVLEPTRIGRRAFVGNSAVIPAGTTLPDETLIGVLSVPPQSEPEVDQPNTSWLGSPAIFLPQRQASSAFSNRSTYRPSRRLYFLRGFIEFFRIILPPAFFVLLACVLLSTGSCLSGVVSIVWLALLFPILYLCCGGAAALIVVLAKWVLMGRYQPAEKSLWSEFVWRTELLTALHENLANPFLVNMLTGTPFVCWYFRLLGARIGKRVFMDTTELTEFDLVSIGDEAALNLDCTLQTHLFEDRVMKMSRIAIGRRCSVGAGSVVLYDSKMGDGAALNSLSLLMKGESLPAATRWEGAPARPARRDIRGHHADCR